MKTIFITGASSGLGKAATKLFAANGWKVIATMRNPKNEVELSQIPNVILLPLDVTNPHQIDKTVAKAIEIADIDVVFNNAGYGLAGPLEALTDEQILRQLNTNLLGTIRTTKAFIPYFRSKRNGLFINTTSIGGLISVPFNSLYHASKWGLEGWSESMAFELRRFGIGIKTVAPGGMKTDFFTRSFDSAKHEAYNTMVDGVMAVITQPEVMATYSEPSQIAAIVYDAATDGKDQLRYIAGEDAKATYAYRQQVGNQVFHDTMDKQFFN